MGNKKKRKTMTALIIILALLVYLTLPFLPSLFVGRGYDDSDLKRMQIVGHRGGASLGPENTLNCIERGMKAAADAIEVDIHLTKDGQLLVCHDQTVDRTTNGKGRICDLTLAETRQLRIVDADGQLTDEHLPTLDEVLTLVGGRCQLLVEIKRTGTLYQGIEQKTVDEIRRHDAQAWVVMQSFNDDVLENLHAIDPKLRLEKLLVAKLPGLPVIIDVGLSVFNFDKYRHVASFNVYNRALSQSFINEVHAHGKEVKAWTLEDVASAPAWPVDGIITNRPDNWRRQ